MKSIIMIQCQTTATSSVNVERRCMRKSCTRLEQRHFQPYYNTVGRLEYQKRKFPYDDYKNYIKKNEPALSIHIPSSDPLKEENVLTSNKEAYDFYGYAEIWYYSVRRGFFICQCFTMYVQKTLIWQNFIIFLTLKHLHLTSIIRFTGEYSMLTETQLLLMSFLRKPRFRRTLLSSSKPANSLPQVQV